MQSSYDHLQRDTNCLFISKHWMFKEEHLRDTKEDINQTNLRKTWTTNKRSINVFYKFRSMFITEIKREKKIYLTNLLRDGWMSWTNSKEEQIYLSREVAKIQLKGHVIIQPTHRIRVLQPTHIHSCNNSLVKNFIIYFLFTFFKNKNNSNWICDMYSFVCNCSTILNLYITVQFLFKKNKIYSTIPFYTCKLFCNLIFCL